VTELVLVLSAAGALDPAAATRAIEAAGGAEGAWLGVDALEAVLPDDDPGRLEAARGVLAGRPIDANLLSGHGRLKKLLIADMDSTMIGVECIDEIADMAGLKPQVAAITEAAMRGDLDFDGALTERVALLRGLPATALAEVYDSRVSLNPGAAVLVRTMAAMGADTALVSGGFTFFSARVAAAAGFSSHRANTLEIADGLLTGRVVPPILGREAKLDRLEALCTAGGYGADAVLAVGDGANDLAMIGAAGLGVAYRAKPAVAAAADARLDHADLSALLYMQGIPRDRWVWPDPNTAPEGTRRPG
jgi:phosphoserine phosphatase